MKLSFGLQTLLLSLTLATACTGENVIEKQANMAPSIQIMSHSDGIEMQDGYVENFRAVVSDDDNDFSELSIAWYVGENLVCDWAEASPAGESFCSVAFSEEDSNIIAEVRDPSGAGARAELTFTVTPTSAPTIELLSPSINQSYYSDQLIQFAGLVSDAEDDASDLLITWTSSLDGELILDTAPNSNGEISDYTYLSEGQHAIELRVEDTSGKVSTEETVILVQGENDNPLCEITAPTDLDSMLLGNSIIFRGLASDSNIDPTDLLTIWSSDKDGELGNGTVNSAGEVTFSYANLTANEHIITLRVEDEVGAACQDTIVVFVGTPPNVGIQSPSNNDVVALNDSVVFQGTVTDQESQAAQLTLEWTSSLDGSLYTGQPTSQGNSQFSTNTLSAGVHSITLSSTDTSGLTSDDVITLRVNTPPTAPTALISPIGATSSDILTATATGSTDADGQSITYSYAWLENGVLTSYTTSMIPASALDVGDIWTVRITPNDGYHDGAYGEYTVIINNSLPSVTTPVITSSSGSLYNDATLTCSATASDPDETVTPTYTWDLNGQSATGATVNLSAYGLSPNDNVSCTATVMDSDGATASDSSTVTLSNRSPVISQSSISPNNPHSESTLTCSATASDPDNDTLSTTYEWLINGSSAGTGGTLSLNSGFVGTGDTVICNITVTDTFGASSTDSTTTTIQSGAPTFDQAATITPSTGITQGTLLTCAAVVSDPDGGTPTLSYQWLVNNTQVGTGSTWTVNGGQAGINDNITCLMTAMDVDGNTASSLSNTVTVSNSAPVISSVTLNTLSPQTNDGLTASVISSDADGHTVTFHYNWVKLDASNGNSMSSVYAGFGSAFSALSSSNFDKNDEIYVVVTPNDGTVNGTSMTSSTATVINTPPDLPILSVTSAVTPPEEGIDDLTCSILSATDADGDALTYIFEWLDPNGNVQQITPNTTSTSDVFGGGGTSAGIWTCEVTVDDGDDSTIDNASITVDSSASPCGSILHEDPYQLGVPAGWILCFIDETDTAYHNTPCNQLLQDLTNGWGSSQLLSAGGNYGCWHGTSQNPEGASYATNNVVSNSCKNNVQQSTHLAAWNPSTTTLGVCIKYP